MVARNAVAAGADVLQGTRRSSRSSSAASCAARSSAGTGEPIEIRARYVVVADGANSRFGRSLGTFRTREWPYGTAIRAYWECPSRRAVDRVGARRERSQRQPAARLRLGVPGRRRHGQHGRRSADHVPRLQERQHHAPARRVRRTSRRTMGDPTRTRPSARPTSGRIPMGGSVGPRPGRRTSSWATRPAGSTRSTARASTTPTRPAAWRPTCCTRRSTTGDPTALQRYPAMLDDEYGQYFKVARLFAKVIGARR